MNMKMNNSMRVLLASFIIAGSMATPIGAEPYDEYSYYCDYCGITTVPAEQDIKSYCCMKGEGDHKSYKGDYCFVEFFHFCFSFYFFFNLLVLN